MAVRRELVYDKRAATRRGQAHVLKKQRNKNKGFDKPKLGRAFADKPLGELPFLSLGNVIKPYAF